MLNGEIWDIALQERKDQIEQLQKEYEELDRKMHVINFEEEMYTKLAERRHKHQEAFEQKRLASEEMYNQLEVKLNALDEEIKLINMEIDYIEEKIRLGSKK